jgi:phenylpropionate dioxygenase-like ring-hydroxylating dioxygenase large terminal subunit
MSGAEGSGADRFGPEVAALRAALGALAGVDRAQSRMAPPGVYTSEAFAAFEAETLFRSEWIPVCHVGEIAAPGDFLTFEAAGELLLATRDAEGTPRVLSNVCRHRGNQVETAPRGNRRSFTCGYHGWTYAADGALKTAPFMRAKPNFDMAACALPRFRTEIWENFLFVNLDGAAPPLGPQMAGLSALMRNYHHADRNLLYMTEDVWETNWKSLAENFLEGYHLSYTHPTTLHPISPTALCRKFSGGEGYTGFHAVYDPSCPDRGPFHPDLTAEERRNSILTCAYPALLLAVATHFSLFVFLRPLGASRVALRWGVAGFGDDPAAQDVQDYVALCHAFNAEDREKLETVAKGLRSRNFSGGPLAPDDLEGTIWDFTQYLARKLGTR